MLDGFAGKLPQKISGDKIAFAAQQLYVKIRFRCFVVFKKKSVQDLGRKKKKKNFSRPKVQRHPVSKGHLPIAVNRLDCAAHEMYDWLTFKAIDSRYLSLVVSRVIDCSGRRYSLPPSLDWFEQEGRCGWEAIFNGCKRKFARNIISLGSPIFAASSGVKRMSPNCG